MKHLTQVMVFLSFLTVLFSNGAAAQTNSSDGPRIEWERMGVGGGGAQFNPAVSPHDSKMALVSCDMGGSYVTHNGGDTWTMFNIGGMVRFFVFDPVDPNVVYAQSSQLFKSVNKGLTWTSFPLTVSDGTQGSSMRTSVQALAIDLAQSKKMYAAVREGQTTVLYTSTDGGGSWKREKEFANDVRNIFINPSSPTDQRTLYVTWNNGVHQRANGQWQSFGTPEGNVRFNFFAGGYDADSKKFILYAISGRSYFHSSDTDSGIFYSEDGGKTWENRQDGLLDFCTPAKRSAEFRVLATSTWNPGTLYVSYNNLSVSDNTSCIGVAKSVDFGKTWTLPWQDKNNTPMSNYSGCWLNELFGVHWGENPFSLAVSAVDPNVCYGSDFGRTIKTENGGKTWEPVYSRRLPDGSWTSRGLDVTTCYQVAFDPFDENHILIATTDIGLQISKNGGKGWMPTARLRNGVPGGWGNNTYWVIFDPEVKGRIWAAMAKDHDIPEPKMFRNAGQVGRYTGGVTLSNDGGATWKAVSQSIGEGAPTHILLDPTSDKDSRTLYACVFGKGVYKSTDSGLTWTQKNKGLPSVEPFVWHIERRESDGTLFLIVSRRSENDSIGTDRDGALFQSTDGAETWTKMTLPEGVNGPADILTTEKYPKRLVLATRSRPSQGGGGIFISDNEGATWTNVLQEHYIYGLTFDPRTSRYYACGFHAAAYYSEDGAKTWNRIKGFDFGGGHRIDLDPQNPEKIYVTTFGGGVWVGPAKGNP